MHFALPFLLTLTGCDLFGIGGPEPEIVVVVRGDTLGEIAKAHGVTVAQLKEWNGLSSDLIEVGQQLKVFTDARPQPPPTVPRRRARAKPTVAGTADDHADPSAPTVPDLAMPPAKPCLAGPNGTDGEAGMVASQGLDAIQIQRTMNAFLPRVGSCLVALDPAPAAPLDLAISVGCDGRVTDVTIRDAGDWPTDHARCLVTALRRAPFPAHALPDGDTFHYPLRMR